MPHHPIIQYIHEAKSHGLSTKEIIQELTRAGWHLHDIDAIILDHEHQLSGEDIISIQGVSQHYGKVKALDNVSLSVKRGSVTALLGPNGAGKTTLIRALTTLLRPTSGMIKIAGFDAVRDAQKLRSIIGLAGQSAALDEILTGRENLEMVGRLYHMKVRDVQTRATELLKQFELEDAADRMVKTYSGGMRRRLDLAASIIFRPKILFLDEPTTGLDPRSRFMLWHTIRNLVEEGTTVMLTTQYMEEADQLAQQIFVIDHGHIIAQGTTDELKRQVGGDVIEIHLTDRHDASNAVSAIAKFSSEQPRVNEDTGVITMAVKGGATILVDVVRQLDSAKLKLSDIILRRPSLDDVFMKLTGHIAE